MTSRLMLTPLLFVVAVGSIASAAPPPSVSVDGVVYIDSDRDGAFTGTDSGISIIEVVLTGPNGDPVVDVDGDEVQSASTNDGRYSFGNLPVLAAGQDYTVTIPPAELAGGSLLVASAGGVPVTDPVVVSAQTGDLAAGETASLDFVLVYDIPYVNVQSFTTAEGPDDGDHDFPSTQQVLQPDAPVDLTYRVANGGSEPLIDITVSHASSGSGAVGDLSCDFSAFGGPAEGVTFPGPLAIGESFDCSARFLGMPAGSEHQSMVSVDATSESGGSVLSDGDAWIARTQSPVTQPTTTTVPTSTTVPEVSPTDVVLPETGGNARIAGLAAVAMALGGALLLLGRTRRHTSDSI